MTERKKMIVGKLYKADDPEFVRLRYKARELLIKINASIRDGKEKRTG